MTMADYVRCHGRLYGAPPTLIVAFDGDTVRVGTADVIHPPTDGDGEII